MRKYFTVTIILLLLIIISACTREAEREFPRVTTLSPGIINQSGAILRGEVKNFKSVDLDDYGFLIGESSNENYDDMIAFSLGSDLGTEVFEGALTSGLEPGKIYYYLAYGISNGILSVGSEISFESQGSSPPVLNGFSPLTGQVGDTLSITCENLLGTREKYSVTFNQSNGVIVYFSDTLIKVIVPWSLDAKQSTISVSGYGNSATMPVQFTLLTPSIDSFSPLSVSPGENITINGTNFHLTKNINKILIGSTPSVVTASTKTQLTVMAPYTSDSLNTITVTVSGQSFTTTDKIKVLHPGGSYFEPSAGTFGDDIHIYGKNLLSFPLEKVLIGDKTAILVSSSDTEIIARVPNNLSSCESEIELVYTGQSVVMDYLFTLIPPSIAGFDETETEVGNDLVINGENFSPQSDNNLVIIGDIEIVPASSSNTQLVVNIDPRVNPGNYFVGVRTCGDYVYSSVSVTITAGSSNASWSRVADFPGGAAYKNSWFTIGEYAYVGIGTRISHDYITDFWRYDPAGDSWTSIADYPGHTRILAPGFSLGENGYVGGGYDFDGPTRDPLYDYYRYSPGNDSWQRISDFPFPVPVSYTPYFEAIGENAYIGTSNTGFYSFSDNPEPWTDLSEGYPDIAAGSTSFVIGEVIYVIDFSNSVWRYDPTNGTWTEKAKFPGEERYSGVGFTIGSNGYFGLGYNGTKFYNDLWKYYPGSDTWELTTSFPGSPRAAPFSFVIGDRAFVGCGVTTSLQLAGDVYMFSPGK